MARRELLGIMMAMALTPAVVAQDFASDRVYLEADVLIDSQDEGVMIAEGNVIARYEGRQLTADRVIYNLETQKVHAIGNVRIMDPDGTVRTAEELEVDGSLSDGVAANFAAQLPQDAVVVARTAARDESGSNSLEYVIYTACPICEAEGSDPTWTLRARRAVQNAETQMITYEGAVFELRGIPVLYLPYFAHPDPSTERRSGLLTPTPELSSKLGFVYEQPYYWAISESSDLTITPKLYTNVNSALNLDYRRRFYSGDLSISTSMAYDYEFDSNGDRQFTNRNGRIVDDPANFTGELFPSEEKFRGHMFAEGEFEISDVWDWGFAIEEVSDDLYPRRYDISDWNTPRGLVDTNPLRLLNQIYLVGQTDNFYTDVISYNAQGLSATDDDGMFARVTPSVYANQIVDWGDYGITSLEGTLAVLDRSGGDDTRRITTSADWQNSFISPGGVVLEPMVRVRADYYDYSIAETTTSAAYEDSQGRTYGLAAATLRYPLIRRGEDLSITFEPIMTVAYSEASVDNGILPNEDSAKYELDHTTMFEADPFTQQDLLETGGRIAAGFRTTFSFDNGLTLRSTFGRRWSDETDPAFSYASNLAGTQSDYLVGGSVDFGNAFSFATNMRVDDDFEVQRTESRMTLNWWRMSGAASYFNIGEDVSFDETPTQRQAIALSASFEVSDDLDLMYRISRNLETNLNQIQAVALRWSDECSFFQIGWQQRQITDRGIGDSNSITFGFGFNTLGQVTSGNFD
ncbi:LPS assembly protein LptD [Ponticaulis sp.]|uniref:LPS-assembly protein LptD n=1 Tax=Ponticaulis sp. TaxID=2020902 RepID=UPI0025FD324B|nr:LPS assembly protein LptD [Ponticaulis sp.]